MIKEIPNLTYINKLARGDISIKKELIDVIKNEFPKEKKDYYISLKNKEFKKIEQNVHKLKHKISILGLEKSYEDAGAFEKNLLDGNNKLQNKFESTLTNITNYLNQL